MASNAKALSFLSGDLSLSGTEVSINVAGSVQSDSITGSTITMKNTGSTIVASDGTTAVLSESSGTVTIDADVSTIGSATISGGSISGTEIDLKSSGTTIFASDGTTAVLSESGGTVTLTADEANVGSNALVVDSSGNVGIGTSSPAVKLDVAGGVRIAYDTFLEADDNLGGWVEMLKTDSSLNTVLANNKGAAIVFNNNATSERMRIDSSGNVRINNTTGLDGQLAVLTGAWYAGAFSNTNSGYPTIYTWNKATSGDNLFINFYTDTGANQRGSIDYNRSAGKIRVNDTSDANLKNIIGDSDGEKSVEILKSTRIREFVWKDDESQKPQIGVIAQELYETYKGAVAVGGDVERTDGEGNVFTEYKPWAVDKTAFTFHLVAGWQRHEKIIKEQQTIIESQQSQIDALTARIEALENP